MQKIETTTPAARGQSAQMVWDAILELHNAEKRINRQAISALTGLRPTIVDDHVERLRDAGKLAGQARATWNCLTPSRRHARSAKLSCRTAW